MAMARAALARAPPARGTKRHDSAPRSRRAPRRPRAALLPPRRSSDPSTADAPPLAFPDGDWRNEALVASLADEGRAHREALGRACTYALWLAYDGERYLGFQYQPRDAKTIQGEVEKALTKLTGEDRSFLGLAASGRTDSGVHARGQVVSFHARAPLDASRMRRALNGMMPTDVRCASARRVHPAFHARFHAVRKTYHYLLDVSEVADPFMRRHAFHCGWRKRPPTARALRDAAAPLVGTHDFSAFANASRDASARGKRDPTRTIFRFDVVELERGLVRLEVEGNGFLYRMVRNMVGAVLMAATKDREDPGETTRRLLEGRDRSAAPTAAPAHGLCLYEVVYPEALLTYLEPGEEEREREDANDA